MIEVIKMAAARSFRRTVNLSGRFGAECPGAMLDVAPRMSPHRACAAPAFLSNSKDWSSARFGWVRYLYS